MKNWTESGAALTSRAPLRPKATGTMDADPGNPKSLPPTAPSRGERITGKLRASPRLDAGSYSHDPDGSAVRPYALTRHSPLRKSGMISRSM